MADYVSISLYDESTGDQITDFQTSSMTLSQLAREMSYIPETGYQMGFFCFRNDQRILPLNHRIQTGDSYTIVSSAPIVIIARFDNFEDQKLRYTVDTTIRHIQKELAPDLDVRPRDVHIIFEGRECFPEEVLGNLGITNNSCIYVKVDNLQEDDQNVQISLSGDILPKIYTLSVSKSDTFEQVRDKVQEHFKLPGFIPPYLKSEQEIVKLSDSVGDFISSHSSISGTPTFEVVRNLYGGSN